METKKQEKIRELEEELRSEWFDMVTPVSMSEEEAEAREAEKRAEAKEYLDLLLELSENFTNVEAKASRTIERKEDGTERIIGPGYFKGKSIIDRIIERAGVETEDDGNPTAEDPYYSDNPYINRRYSLQLADEILRADKDVVETIEYVDDARRQRTQIEEVKEDRQKEEQEKRFGQRVLGAISYLRDKRRINAVESEIGAKHRVGKGHIMTAHDRLSLALSMAYSDKRIFKRGDSDEAVRQEMYENWDAWREKFWGDEGRREKVRRAQELQYLVDKKD